MRVRFVTSPLTVDEGGYLAVARAWSRGARLYEDVWVDRPQGLLTVYRVLHVLGLGTPVGIRLLAIGACGIGTVACGHIAARLSGERARLPAGVCVAVFVSLPQIEGHTANAELLSASLGAVALALCLEAVGRDSTCWMLAAGSAGGAALTVKQSAFDALGTAFVFVALFGALAPAVRWSRVGLLAAGTTIPIGLCALHGALTGWDRWWFAVAGYRLAQRSAFADARFERIGPVWDVIRPGVAVLTVVLVGGAVVGLLRSSDARRVTAVFVVWSLLAVLAFALGGQFFRHYWTIIAFPASTAGGVLVGSLHACSARVALGLATLVGPTLLTLDAVSLPRADVGPVLHGDGRLVKSEEVAEWFGGASSPGDRLYVMCASAAVYGDGDIDPPYPYLWLDGVRQIPGSIDRLAEMLSGSRRPRFVAMFQPADFCDPSGRVEAVLEQHYALRASVANGEILEAQD